MVLDIWLSTPSKFEIILMIHHLRHGSSIISLIKNRRVDSSGKGGEITRTPAGIDKESTGAGRATSPSRSRGGPGIVFIFFCRVMIQEFSSNTS